MTDRPAGEAAHLTQRHAERLFERGRFVRRCRRAAQQLQRVGATTDRRQHPVVLGGDPAHLGVRLDPDGPSEVAAAPLLVDVREEIGDLGAGTVLGDVEPGELALAVDPQRKAAVDHRQRDQRHTERPHEAHDDADELDAELLDPVRRRRERVDVTEQGDGQRSPDARTEVHRHRADGVVDAQAFEHDRDGQHDDGADSTDERGLARADDVRRRRDRDQPASEPFMIITTSGRRSRHHVNAMPTRPPNVAASVVFRMIAGTSLGQRERAAAVEAVPADPQHEHAERRERQVVSVDRRRLPGPKRPILGPMTMIAASAAQPPVEWTTVDPAKSTKPSSLSQPSEPTARAGSDASPHAQWPKTG